MATRLPNPLSRSAALRPSLTRTSAPSQTPLSWTPSRASTIIRRPKRPYAFTQIIALSDGSTYTVRTTSPHALYRSAKDSRNHVLWQPSEKSLQNVEVDEAGKLAAFRERFGSGWDAEKPGGGGGGGEGPEEAAAGPSDDLGDLISGYATPDQNIAPAQSKKKKTPKK
ncbi:hypothetical protein F4780DRAFT_714217 [Xylariomycetidae sp. FL0641]|nr:hypothetical protein F4780DRAFT_714217 [Xylariomycetidae sp. FL0641]